MSDTQQTVLDVRVEAGEVGLEGILSVPVGARGIVVFVHGSGSSRFSRRNHYVAGVMNQGSLATLLFDLLTPEEHSIDEDTRELRFDIDLLSRRTVATVDWLADLASIGTLPIGLFGASTGAAAALNAAAVRPQRIAAVVSRGGRPDLALQSLAKVKAPTLFIVGGLDVQVISLNERAQAAMQAPCQLQIVERATHLFEEPGTLQQVASLACDWFVKHLNSDLLNSELP